MDVQISNLSTELVGIAKDGRVIYGPIKSGDTALDAVLYSACDLDICNGLQSSVVGNADPTLMNYSYRATKFHPYLVGCFGPGSNMDVALTGQYCTTNEKYCGAFDGVVASALVVLAALTLLFH